MPELPDITLYVEALQKRLIGASLVQVRIWSPFLLRTAAPPVPSIVGQHVTSVARMGKRIVIGFESDLWLVLHLMIAGRLHWTPRPIDTSQASAQAPAGRARTGKRPTSPSRNPALASFEFTTGTLTITEAAKKKRASLHLFHGKDSWRCLDPGGLEVLESDAVAFSRVLTSQNHTLKRALTDPRLFSGIGNSFSDEILHRASLSPVALTQRLSPEQIERLYHAIRDTLCSWTNLLRKQAGDAFPEHVTAFRPEMAVHGRYGLPCPVCGTKVQRIRYAENETNYCPQCQTGGKLLADRSLSLLLKRDWPKTPEELEELRSAKADRH